MRGRHCAYKDTRAKLYTTWNYLNVGATNYTERVQPITWKAFVPGGPCTVSQTLKETRSLTKTNILLYFVYRILPLKTFTFGKYFFHTRTHAHTNQHIATDKQTRIENSLQYRNNNELTCKLWYSQNSNERLLSELNHACTESYYSSMVAIIYKRP